MQKKNCDLQYQTLYSGILNKRKPPTASAILYMNDWLVAKSSAIYYYYYYYLRAHCVKLAGIYHISSAKYLQTFSMF